MEAARAAPVVRVVAVADEAAAVRVERAVVVRVEAATSRLRCS